MGDSIFHKHPLPTKDKKRDCTKCEHAKLIAPHEWECDAVLYDIKNLTCFVERKNDPANCRYHTVRAYDGMGICLGTKEIDPCKGENCENWEPKED